jgi:hypothetical protein
MIGPDGRDAPSSPTSPVVAGMRPSTTPIRGVLWVTAAVVAPLAAALAWVPFRIRLSNIDVEVG